MVNGDTFPIDKHERILWGTYRSRSVVFSRFEPFFPVRSHHISKQYLSASSFLCSDMIEFVHFRPSNVPLTGLIYFQMVQL